MISGFASRREHGIFFVVWAVFFFTIITLVAVIFCLELFLRVYYRDVLSTADGKSYFSVTHQHLFKSEINGYRLRGRSFSEQPGDNRYRVAVIGDSFTCGQGVYPADKRFTELVERQLREKNEQAGIEVENIGICGFNLEDHLKFTKFVDAIQPDYVLYQWYVNDMVSPAGSGGFKPELLVGNRKLHAWLWRHSALYYMLQRGYGALQRKKGIKKTYARHLVDQLGDATGQAALRAGNLLRRLVSHYRARGTDFGIVLFPTFSDPMDQYRLGFLHEQVLEVCAEQKIPCLDLRDAYRNYSNRDLWANVFDPHPGALAHAVAAQNIVDFFGSSWVAKAMEKQRNFPENILSEVSQ